MTSDTRPLLMPEGGGGGGAGGSGAPGAKPTAEDYAKYAFYNIRKYRPYFDVDTKVCCWEGGQSRKMIITGQTLGQLELSSPGNAGSLTHASFPVHWPPPPLIMQEVLWRVMSSFIGVFKPDFMDATQAQPDL